MQQHGRPGHDLIRHERCAAAFDSRFQPVPEVSAVISVKIDDSAVQQLQQRLAGLAPRVVAQVYKALQPLIYQSLQTAVPKYFAGSAGKGGSSDLLTSRSGNRLNSFLQSIALKTDGQSLTL